MSAAGILPRSFKRQSPKDFLIDGQVVCYHRRRHTERDFSHVVRTASSRTCTSSFGISNLGADNIAEGLL